eukprot:CAMPEP_0170136358 /NCGR_PEP_ID=MMETSP0033_2-20121228/3226_1 /TAXON_ID=195969 /ORGANISM="Dolichomastix tenuilepis, Strain CCMP3274" /LENGTH=364 /DNA_ID=CAMNT_0010372059 /DNA_START=99 /DNA_END=1193 /DNA_ORIENTATION=+
MRRAIVVFCGKRKSGGGSGKRSSTPNSPSAPKDGTQGTDPPSPRRITGRAGGMSIKTQKRIVDRIRQAEAGSSSYRKRGSSNKPLKQVSYRREKDEEYEEKRLRRRAQAMTKLEMFNMYGTDGRSLPPCMVVDGYNVCGRWDVLKKHFAHGRLEQARDRLERELRGYANHRGFRLILVYDAMNNQFGNNVTTRENEGGVLEVVFVARVEADTYIEAEIMRLVKDKEVPLVLVATGDRAVGNIAIGAGATHMSSDWLIKDIKQAKASVSAQMAQLELKKRSANTRLSGAFDEALTQKFQQLRGATRAAPATAKAAQDGENEGEKEKEEAEQERKGSSGEQEETPRAEKVRDSSPIMASRSNDDAE